MQWERGRLAHFIALTSALGVIAWLLPCIVDPTTTRVLGGGGAGEETLLQKGPSPTNHPQRDINEKLAGIECPSPTKHFPTILPNNSSQ